jgi:hypothetical protein
MNFSTISSEPVGRPARSYVIATVAIAVAWLAATMAANVIIDPQAVFGTNLVRVHFNPNARYSAFRDYEAAPDRFDAVLFASSRGNAFDRTLLAEQLGVRKVANFSVPFGLLSDHLPALDFLLRDKAARGGRLAAVFLVLDADFFGKAPWTNLNIDSFLPPQISGESAFRFWWRYLTAFQFRHWKKDLDALAGSRPVAGPEPGIMRTKLSVAGLVPVRPPGPIAKGATPVAETFLEETDAPEIRSDLARQLELLARFVALCRARDARLVIAFSPLNRKNVRDDQAPDNERIVDQVARLVPVWDFDRPAWLSDRPDLWLDFSHYSTAVATMMTQRIFGAETPAPAGFGRLRGQ